MVWDITHNLDNLCLCAFPTTLAEKLRETTFKMASGADQLYALKYPFKDPKFIFFTDFDGTITLKDSNDYMVSYGILTAWRF